MGFYTSMKQVADFVSAHPECKLYSHQLSTESSLLSTTIYAGDSGWDEFVYHTGLNATTIIKEALDHPGLFLSVNDVKYGQPWPVGNNITYMPQHSALAVFKGTTYARRAAAVLTACAARWLIETSDHPILQIAVPWLNVKEIKMAA